MVEQVLNAPGAALEPESGVAGCGEQQAGVGMSGETRRMLKVQATRRHTAGGTAGGVGCSGSDGIETQPTSSAVLMIEQMFAGS